MWTFKCIDNSIIEGNPGIVKLEKERVFILVVPATCHIRTLFRCPYRRTRFRGQVTIELTPGPEAAPELAENLISLCLVGTSGSRCQPVIVVQPAQNWEGDDLACPLLFRN